MSIPTPTIQPEQVPATPVAPPPVQMAPPPVQTAPATAAPPPAMMAPPPATMAPPPPPVMAPPVQQSVPAVIDQPMPGQQLAPAQQTAMAAAPADMTLEQWAVANGFEGVNFNAYGIVPNITLTGSMFMLGDKEELGNEFYCRINSTRSKWLFMYPSPKADREKEILYSYDKINSASGTYTVEAFQQEAAKLGVAVECKLYHEMSATLADNRMVNLSIPDLGSGTAVALFLASCYAARRTPSQVLARVSRGERVEKTKVSFYPWKIEIAG